MFYITKIKSQQTVFFLYFFVPFGRETKSTSSRYSLASKRKPFSSWEVGKESTTMPLEKG